MHIAQFGALLGLLGSAVQANPVRPGSVVVRSPENEARGLLTSLLGGESSSETTTSSESSYSESHSESSSSSSSSSGGLLSSVTSSSSESHSSSSSSSCSYDISRTWENQVLYAG